MKVEIVVNNVEALTQRQNEVLELLVKGYSIKKIANGFGITEGTVKLHSKAVTTYLESNRYSLLYKCLEKGIVEVIYDK